MENNKISFSVENIEIEEPQGEVQFATLKIDAFASGPNRHDLYVSSDTLRRTAETIKEKPLVWVFDSRFLDAGSHDSLETPCGFIPKDTPIEFRELPDGRTMMSVVGKIWVKYSGKLLDFFKRDGLEKPVSVEMSVYKKEFTEHGNELLDYVFECITILGTLVTPAIRSARAELVDFAAKEKEEYENLVKQEFSKYDSIDFTIPTRVKSNAQKGLDLYKEYNKGGNSVSLSVARHFVKNDKSTPEKVRHTVKSFKNKKFLNIQKDPVSVEYIEYSLYGGKEGKEWAEKLSNELDKRDNQSLSYFGEEITFPYTSAKDMNPALRGIDPPISLGQGNEIAKSADAIGADKSGWPIAISNFKKSHKVKDGHWVKMSDESDEDTNEGDNMEEFVFAKEDLGKGSALKVDKSKDKLSETAWGSVDKTSLMHKILNASNYKSLVHDVYLIVGEGWEDSPSSKLKYPVMQVSGDTLVYNRYGLSAALGRAQGQGESGVVSKINGIYKKLGLDDKSKKEEMSLDKKEDENVEEKPKEEMAVEEMAAKKDAETPEQKAEKTEEKKEDPKEEATESPDAEAKEEKVEDKDKKDEEKKEKMSLDANLDLKAALAFLQSETEAYQELADEYDSENGSQNYAKLAYALFAKGKKLEEMCNTYSAEKEEMCGKFAAEEEKNKAYMAENEELKKFKADFEARQFEAEVNYTLKTIGESVDMPKEDMAMLYEEAKKFSLETIDAFKNLAKAKAFNFAVKGGKKSNEPVKYALPWVIPDESRKVSDSPWKR